MRPRLLSLLCLLMLLHCPRLGAKELQVVFNAPTDFFQKQTSGNFILSKDGVSISVELQTETDYYRWYKDKIWSFSSANLIKKIELFKEGKTGSNTNVFQKIELSDASQPGKITTDKNKDHVTWEYEKGINSVSLINSEYVVWFTKIIVTIDVPVIDGSSESALNANIIKDMDNKRELTVSLQRKFVADGGWYTLCLPFYRTINQTKWAFGADVEVYWFTGVKHNEDGTIEVVFTPYSDTYPIVSGKPCLIKPSKDTGDETVFSRVNIHYNESMVEEHDGVRFVGTYDPMAFPKDDNQYAFLYGNDGLSLAADDGSGGKLKGTRAYFVLPSGALAVGKVVLSETDGVESPQLNGKKNPSTDCYYTLTGLRIQGEPLRPGVYIHAGRKIVVR